MPNANIRAAIVDVLEGVTGIGNVHAFERYSSTQAGFRDLYETGGKILGWHVRRVSQQREIKSSPMHIEVFTKWQIRGFMSLEDSAQTEEAFDDLIDSIIDAFDADPDLGGTVDDIVTEQGAGIQLVDSTPVMFAGVLCHSARLILTTLEEIYDA